LPDSVSRRHILVLATSGTGKSVCLKHYLTTLKARRVSTAQVNKCVIYDVKGEFCGKDLETDDLILYPFDRRSVPWRVPRTPLARYRRCLRAVSPPLAPRLLGLLCWEGRAFVGHLMTEFYDPWEHFYDHYRTDNPHHLVPTEYRLREIAEAMRDIHGLKGTDALAWTDTWLAERLLRLRPPLSLLTTFVRHAIDHDKVGVLADAVRKGEDGAVLSHCLVRMPSHELQVADPSRSIPAFARGTNGVLRWHAPFVERLGGHDSAMVAHMIARCLANRDWNDLAGKLLVDEMADTVQPGPALFAELRKQMRGAETPRWVASGTPFSGDYWLRQLIGTRMEAACVTIR